MQVRPKDNISNCLEKHNISYHRSYVVLGVTLEINQDNQPIITIEIQDDANNLSSLPLDLFHLVSNTCSKYWKLSVSDHMGVKLWPEEFYSQYFHDDLSSGIKSVLETYKKLVSKLEAESGMRVILNTLGKLNSGNYQKYFIKITDDFTVSGGYLLSLYKTLPQQDSDIDEWFDSYEELEKYFKDNNLQVEWLED